VLLRDVDKDGRLDLIVVLAKGSTGLFSAFEATAMHFPGGHVYNREQNKFLQPKSRIKVAGALLEPMLLDLDGDGDDDLVLSTIDTGILAGATGSAPGVFHGFRFEEGAFQRNPAWTVRGSVPLAAFTEDPRAPVTFLGDLDGDGRPEALSLGKKVALLGAGADGTFAAVAEAEFEATGRPAIGRRLAALPGKSGVLVARAGE
jgi:hypothetical protein